MDKSFLPVAFFNGHDMLDGDALFDDERTALNRIVNARDDLQFTRFTDLKFTWRLYALDLEATGRPHEWKEVSRELVDMGSNINLEFARNSYGKAHH